MNWRDQQILHAGIRTALEFADAEIERLAACEPTAAAALRRFRRRAEAELVRWHPDEPLPDNVVSLSPKSSGAQR